MPIHFYCNCFGLCPLNNSTSHLTDAGFVNSEASFNDISDPLTPSVSFSSDEMEKASLFYR